jgi:spore coat protein U-like protein
MKFSKIALSTLSTAVMGFLALGIASTPAAAATTTNTSTFLVTATVSAGCSVSSAGIAFGTYTGAAVQITGTLSVQCSVASVPVTVTLDKGANGLTAATRQMLGPSSGKLNYTLAQGSYAGANWDSLVINTTTALTAVSTNIYATLPGGQSVPVGSYTDTITATFSY